MSLVSAKDTLRIHFTVIGHQYMLVDEDDECYKIIDERGVGNWIPKRYMELVGHQEGEHGKD